MNIKKISKLIPLLLISKIGYSQYALVNKVSETITGQTDTVPLAPILKTANNTYIVSANQKISSTQNDFKTTSLTGNIITVWSQLFNVSNKKAFTTATTSDNSGNIYVVGSTYVNSTNGQDLTVIKYNNAGVQQWVKHYNGPGNNYDIAADVVVDASGNVYVTGASVGFLFALVDFVTIKYNSAGTQQWVSRYNFSNGIDIPAGILLDNSGNVVVSGSSASSSINNNWDFTTVKYNATTGTQMQAQRQVNAGVAQDKVLASTKDNNGNIYTTGLTSSNGVNFDVQTIKYDMNMNVVWVKTFDGYGNFDQGADVAVDNLGNVIVTGYATKQNLTKELLVLSYSSSGTLNWQMLKQPKINSSNAEGLKVRIKTNNEIFVGGNYSTNNNSDMAVLRFDGSGNNTLEKIYNGASNLDDQLLDLLVDGNFIIVSGKTNNGVIDQNVTIKYEYKDFVITPALNSMGKDYNQNHLIIAFNKTALKINNINNKNLLFGRLNDFVKDSVCNRIDTTMGFNLKSANFNASKIFANQTTADTISISRQGDNTRIPDFFGYLLVEVPQGFNVDMAVDTLGYIKPDINYCEYNYLYSLNFVPNDVLYNSNQASLHSIPTFPNANINCEPAWDYTKGKPFVKVGIYDTGIESANSDLNGIVFGGYDYANNTSISGTDQNGHGTSCAGIVGAKSNNNNGISGIAGGDWTLNQPGVQLYDYRIASGSNSNFASNQGIGQAIIGGAKSLSAGGDELNVMNNSWGSNATYDGFLMDAINFANRQGVAFVAARGNDGTSGSNIPSTLKQQIIISVGASGVDGHYQNPASGGDNYSSSFGYPMDFVAPGTSQIIRTTKPGNAFGGFNGTSAATPHAAGLCALLMSYLNQPTPNWNNLTSEDCEFIILKSCTDLTGLYGETPGYDAPTGHGRINAGAALASVQQPKYKIRHVDQSHFATGVSKVVNTVASNQQFIFQGSSTIPAGTYIMDVYETITTLNYNLNPNENVVSYWPLFKASTGVAKYGNVINTDEPWFCEVISANNTQAQLRTYTILIKYNILGQLLNIQYPMNSTAVNSALTLYTYDPTAVGLKEQNLESADYKLFPNPTKNSFNLRFDSNTNSQIKITIHDVMGKQVLELNESSTVGVNNLTINTNSLLSGLYFVTLENGNNKSVIKKLIIE